MDSATAHKLADLNRAFYDQHGEDFADSRPRLYPGVKRVLAQIEPGASVLEIGCGDGKVGRWLAQRGVRYLGLDNSPVMIERAKRFSEQWIVDSGQSLSTVHYPLSFEQADVLTSDWSQPVEGRMFDWILAFAVFHHLPGAEARARVLRELAAHLIPGGRLAMSNWQFTRSERLRQRIAPWSALGLTQVDVEPNDYLLTWERKGQRGLRYVHVLDEAEARQMAENAALNVVEIFQSDGESGTLTDYVVMQRG
jgi:SAM-dependent methyltransferase